MMTTRRRKVPKIVGVDGDAICDYPRGYSRELVDRFLNGSPFVARHEGYGHAAIAAKYSRIVVEAARRQSERQLSAVGLVADGTGQSEEADSRR